MINKPKMLARKLLGQSIDDLIAEEVDYVMTELIKEFGTASMGELLFKVVEKYHKTLKPKFKRGPKEKWSPLLRAMIKVEVDARRRSGASLKSVIHELSKDPLWAVFIGTSDDSFRKAYKQKQELWAFQCAERMRQFDDLWREQVQAEVQRFRDLI